jgi:hypothetical protein
MQRHPSQASWTQFLKMPTDELWNNVSIRVRSRLCDCRNFFAERFFVISILVSTRGLFRKCCPTQRAPDPWGSTKTTLAPHVICLANHAGVVVGVAAFSGSLRSLDLIPTKRRCLLPPTSTPKGHNANRWASLY